MRAILAIAVASILGGCSTLPRDPEHTLDRVRDTYRVRVGLVEHPPWVVRTASEPQGAEVELVRRFAGELGASPVWLWGDEQQHMRALEHFELEIVIAGLDKSTPWAKTIGITRPYFQERIVVGVPAGVAPLETLNGVTVAVKAGDESAALLAKKHANVVRFLDMSKPSGPAAIPDWRLEQLGYATTKFDLMKNSHVMAIPPGENAWLKRLEEFLFQHQNDVKSLLQKQEGRS